MTNTDLSAGDGEALSIDQAAELLVERPEDEGLADEATELDPDDERQADEEDEDGEDIRPPHSWDAAAKARFKDLPADVQALIAEREGSRDRATSMALQEAAEARRRADADASEAAQMTEALDALIPDAAAAFQRWQGIDWQAWAEANPQAALKARLDFEAEREQLQRLAVAQEEASALEHRRYVAREAEALKAAAPELADPKAGPARRQELAQFLTAMGASPEQLARLSATEAAIAYEALQWRKAKSGLATRADGGRPGLRPSAAQAEPSSRRRTSEAYARLTRSGSVDDAVAYLKQRGGA